MFSSNITKIVVLIVLLALAGGGYYLYSNGSIDIPTELITSDQTSVVGQDIIVLVSKLNSISIDTDVFSSVLFTSLKDISKMIDTESVGRPNPFAPIGSEGLLQIETITRTPSDSAPENPSDL